MVRTLTPFARTVRLLTLAAAALATLTIAGLSDASARTRNNPLNANASLGSRGFSGVASYYGAAFAGRKTASGVRFNPGGMTAAHRSLPFGTRLRVSHGARSVVVTINDRGPFIRGRVLDLSHGAARAIGISGVGRVVAEAM